MIDPLIRPEAGHTLLVGQSKAKFALDDQRYSLLVLGQHGRCAWWWSFPLHPEMKAALDKWPYFYNYYGTPQQKLLSRCRVIDHTTSTGNAGIPSPWPEVTDESQRGLTRAGPKQSDIFKTWFLFDAFETLEPPVALDELECLDGQPAKPLRSGFRLWRLKSAAG